MKLRLFSLLAVLAVFTAYTAVIVINHGYTGFLELPEQGGWAAQVFIDLCVALILFVVWMVPDARERGLPSLPYVLAILTTGSIGALAYLLHRTLREGSGAAQQAPRSAALS